MVKPRQVLLWAIRGYQLVISPMLGPRCRFYPSCSCYAHTAIEQHGIWRGLMARATPLATLSSIHARRLRPGAG